MSDAGCPSADVVITCRDGEQSRVSLFAEDGTEQITSVPGACGTGGFTAMRPVPGISLVRVSVARSSSPCFWRLLTRGPHFSCVYHLRDAGSVVRSIDRTLSFQVESGTSTFGHSPVPVEIRPPNNTTIDAVYLLVEPSVFEPLWEDPTNPVVATAVRAMNHPELSAIHRTAMTAGMSLSFAEVFACPYQGALRRIYLEGKCLELLAQHMASAARVGGTEAANFLSDIKLSPRDISRLREAKQYLVDRMQDPPTLAELSRDVGVNVKKLKIGFRKLFGTTVFGSLRQIRLEHARRLLSERDCNVSEACYECGYTSLSHFSAAFRREFGVAPHTYRRQGGGSHDLPFPG